MKQLYVLPNKQAIKYKCLSHLKLKVHNGQNVRLSGAVCPVNKVLFLTDINGQID